MMRSGAEEWTYAPSRRRYARSCSPSVTHSISTGNGLLRNASRTRYASPRLSSPSKTFIWVCPIPMANNPLTFHEGWITPVPTQLAAVRPQFHNRRAKYATQFDLRPHLRNRYPADREVAARVRRFVVVRRRPAFGTLCPSLVPTARRNPDARNSVHKEDRRGLPPADNIRYRFSRFRAVSVASFAMPCAFAIVRSATRKSSSSSSISSSRAALT